MKPKPDKEKFKSKQRKYDLTHARHDLIHCLAPGLFRSLRPGERKHTKLDVVYEYGEGKRIEFGGQEPLGVDDLRILQGLIAIAGPSGLFLSPEPKTEVGLVLRNELELQWDAVKNNALVVKGSYRKLAKEIGYSEDSGRHFELIRKSIERLWKVSIIVQNGSKREGFRLLSAYSSDSSSGKLYVALNPIIAQAVMGGQHCRISMEEVRALKSDPARLIHQRLCAWINPGKSGKLELDTLCEYVWPTAANSEAMKKRRQTLRQALTELISLGWTVEEYSRGKFEIGRSI